MNQYYELGIKLAAGNPYAGKGGGSLAPSQPVGPKPISKVPAQAAQVAPTEAFMRPSAATMRPTHAGTGGAPPQAAVPSSPGANAPGGPTGAGPIPTPMASTQSSGDIPLPLYERGWQGSVVGNTAARTGMRVANRAGIQVPTVAQHAVNYYPQRSWPQFAGSVAGRSWPQFFNPLSRLPKSWGGSGLAQKAMPNLLSAGTKQLGQRVGGKTLGGLLSSAASFGGPIATPVNAAMEGMDAVGALPQALGGTGLALPSSWGGIGSKGFGWAPELEFRKDTSIGGKGDTFGYTGPGWQALNYAGASLNSWTKPTRSYSEVGHAITPGGSVSRELGSGLLGAHKNNQMAQQISSNRNNATPFTAEQMNQMAQGQGGFYNDQALGHMMPTADYFNQGTDKHDDLWRRRVAGATGATGWQPSQ